MRSRMVTRADGPDIHVVEAGPPDAQAVLFVHGYSQSHLSWQKQFESELAEDHRLIAMDLRGHGESAKPDAGYDDGEAWAGDVAAVLEALDLDDVLLVGWSYGSLVALDYLAARGTDRVAGVTLVGTVLGIGTPETNEWLQPAYLDLFPDIVSTDAETSVAALEAFVECCVHGDLSAADRYRMLGFNAVVPPRVRDAMRDRSVAHFETLEGLDVPVLLAHGAHDQVVAPEASRVAAERLADSRLSIYEDSGHSPFWEQPGRFNEGLRAFAAELE